MKPKKLVAGVAVATGALVLLSTILFKDEIHDWLYAIRRVRTWGDLLAQKPIQLSDGVIVRLGIEDTRCPQGSGVLLYCLTEGYDPGSIDEVNESTFGPLEASVIEDGMIAKESSSEKQRFRSPIEKSAASARWLFTRSIPVARSGEYRVKVSERGKALRHVTVKGTAEPIHPWLTLEESPDDLLDPGVDFLGTFLPAGSPVIPSSCGYVPFMNVEHGIDPALGLPRLLTVAHPELNLRKEADALVVTSTSKIRLRRSNFAARWWINGTPHVPEHRSSFSVEVRRPVQDVEQLRLEVDLDPSKGVVRPGDRVSLQLLYSDHGWSLTDDDILPFGGREIVTGYYFVSEDPRLLQSNRIELMVP